VKNKILKVYIMMMKSSFTRWKKHIFDKETLAKMRMVQQLQMQSESMANEALEEER